MNYVSLFSGIEAASVAWAPLGWTPVAFSEVDRFCCDLLKMRFPDVRNLGDIKEIEWGPYRESVDLVVGGSPCQAFSVAGKRGGIMDARGRLMFEYCRAIREIHPRWLLWENVPGVLSQSDGSAFATLIEELERCGYSLAWRVLDAQHFGVAQRRRRVFLVGHNRVACAAAVLFEREGLQWDYPTSQAKRASLAENRRDGASGRHEVERGSAYAVKTSQTNQNGTPFSEELAHTLDCASPEAIAFAQNSRDEVRVVGGDGSIAGALCAEAGSKQQTYVAFMAGQSSTSGSIAASDDIAPTLRASSSGTNQVPTICMADTQSNTSVDVDLCGTITEHSRKDPPMVCFQVQEKNDEALRVLSNGSDLVGSLCASDYHGIGNQYVNDGKAVAEVRAGKALVRRLTPVECERLQGFPDGWTDIYPNRKKGTPDGLRYKALGNSMAVPVIEWIGRRIEAVDRIVKEESRAV